MRTAGFGVDRVCNIGFVLILTLLAVGCATPERLAKRILTAPNLQQRSVAQWGEQWIQAMSGGTNRFETLTVSVGPPDAKLNVAELPPGAYNLEFTSSIETKANGARQFLLQCSPKTNCPATTVEERGTVVILHGYSVQKETMIPWAFVLAQAGFRAVLVDLRGHGRSTGQNFSCGKVETSDLVQLLDHLIDKGVCKGPVGVLGLSFGADLALQWAARDPRVHAVVAIAPYNRPEEAFVRFAKEMGFPVSVKTLESALGVVALKLDLNWSDWSGEAAVRRIPQPVFLIGGEKDPISPPRDLDEIKRAAAEGTEMLLVPEANHFIIGFSFQQIAEPVKAWFQARL